MKGQAALLIGGNTPILGRADKDFYATDPKAMELLLKRETFSNVWECACGKLHLANVLNKHGFLKRASDIVNRADNEIYDFLSLDNQRWHGDIITNPPYKVAEQFVEKAMSIIPKGNKVAMFLKLQFLEGKNRKELFRVYPPYKVYVCSGRLNCVRNAEFDRFPNNSAICYAWFVWIKGFKGSPTLDWIN